MPIQDPAWHKSWYEANKERRLAQMKAKRDSNRKMLAEIKESHPCHDCGKFYPWYIMQFDHVQSNKAFTISAVMSTSQDRLLEEVAKCEIVCANCHAERTYQRSHATVV